MSEDVAAGNPNKDVPDLLDEAAAAIEQKDRLIELQGAQLGVLQFVEKVLHAGAYLKPNPMGGEYPTLVSKLQERAKTIRRVTK